VLDNVPPLPPTQTPQWSTLATISDKGKLATVGDITTPSGMKYPATVTQLPYVGLKGLAITSPCNVAKAAAAVDPAPATSPLSLSALILLVLLGAGTSWRRRRQTKRAP
jgi:MYXO-CTERM domain-containing protein